MKSTGGFKAVSLPFSADDMRSSLSFVLDTGRYDFLREDAEYGEFKVMLLDTDNCQIFLPMMREWCIF